MNKKKKKKRCDAITRMRRVSISRARSSIRLAQEEKERVYFSFFSHPRNASSFVNDASTLLARTATLDDEGETIHGEIPLVNNHNGFFLLSLSSLSLDSTRPRYFLGARVPWTTMAFRD